jgi:hypothetical protein
MKICHYFVHTIYGVVCLRVNDILDGVFLPHVYSLVVNNKVYIS